MQTIKIEKRNCKSGKPKQHTGWVQTEFEYHQSVALLTVHSLTDLLVPTTTIIHTQTIKIEYTLKPCILAKPISLIYNECIHPTKR